ncbi:alpha/beta fold hydrolase [Pseudahrensia aquimaris]|uniref:Alpha/beta fold hydrolase n=1 Tax=Pseudahrensia aquimaris TaxID=744461 RepID=A0ABW3FFR1_9HYPH
MSLNVIQQAGPEGAKDLFVFIHGFGGCAAEWRGLQRHLSDRAPSWAFDLPGHAGSLDSGIKMTPKNAALAVLEALERRSERVHVVGHSMGGAVASLMAIIAPDRISSLTLLAPGGFGPGIAHDTLTTWADAQTTADVEAVMPSFFHADYTIDPRIIQMNAELRVQPGAVSSLQEIATRLARNGVQGELPLDDLWTSAVPITVIWGRDDAILPVEQAEALQPLAKSGRIKLHIVDGMGHSPPVEAPDLVRAAIAQNLSA